MYAVIKTGGKQYRVSEGDTIEVEHLSLKGNEATFKPILVSTDDGETLIGNQALKDYEVAVRVVGDAKGDKISVLKYRPKSGYAAKSGHRQLYSVIEVVAIGPKGQKRPARDSAKEEKAESTTQDPAAEKKVKAAPKATTKKSDAPKEEAE